MLTTIFIVWQILLVVIPLVSMVFASENYSKKLAALQPSKWDFVETHLQQKLRRNSVKKFVEVILPTLMTELCRAPLLATLMVGGMVYGKSLAAFFRSDYIFVAIFLFYLFVCCVVGLFASTKTKFGGTVFFEISVSVLVAVGVALFYDMYHMVDPLIVLWLKMVGVALYNLYFIGYTRLYMWLINAKVLP